MKINYKQIKKILIYYGKYKYRQQNNKFKANRKFS